METDVIVVGAGPVGLMLAGEVRLGGANVMVCEKRLTPSGESRGVGFTRRAAEVFHQRGLLSRLGDIEYGNQGHFGGVRIDFGMLEDNHFGVRGVPQYRVEEMLENWVTELGVKVLRGHELVDLRQSEDGVVAVTDGPDGRGEFSAAYLVGCDGGRSTVRKLVGIDFPGTEPTRGMYLADVAGCDIPQRHIGEKVDNGMVLSVRLEEGVDRIIIHERGLRPRSDENPLTFEEIADSWERLTGQSLHGADVRWISSFTDASRQAAEYRRGRVFVAGDSAHIHIPAGAQGLSVGVQDAVNLGWKLAAVVKGWAPEGLLETYHAERHPVGQRLLRNTRAQALLYLSGEEMEPMRSIMSELARIPEAARKLAGMVSGLEVRYDMGASGHPLLGLRMPDHTVEPADGGRTRISQLLRPARGVLVDTGLDPREEALAAGFADRIDVVKGRWVAAEAPDRLPVPEGPVLLRPDGHVAWAAPDGGELAAALGRWFGTADSAAASGARPLASAS